MPYTPDEQRILDYATNRITQIKNGYMYPCDQRGIEELRHLLDFLRDIKATRDKEYPIDQKGE